MELTEIKERIDTYYRPRDKEEETLNQYVKGLVKELEKRIGFTKFHQHIHLVLKTMIGMQGIENRLRWEQVCMTITGNEPIWLVAIGSYLTPEQIEENEHNSF